LERQELTIKNAKSKPGRDVKIKLPHMIFMMPFYYPVRLWQGASLAILIFSMLFDLTRYNLRKQLSDPNEIILRY
jgi:hypothetical protein